MLVLVVSYLQDQNSLNHLGSVMDKPSSHKVDK